MMHGDLPQPIRNRIMQGFRDGKLIYLVATDVVGRGIDVKNISHVINFDVPSDPENYVHRIGRTGRIGADGIAIAFVTPEQGEHLTEIEGYINVMIDEDSIEGFEAFHPRTRVLGSLRPQAGGAGVWTAHQEVQQTHLTGEPLPWFNRAHGRALVGLACIRESFFPRYACNPGIIG